MIDTILDTVVHHAPTVAMLGFLAGFIGIAIWAYAPRNKQKLESHADIPLREK